MRYICFLFIFILFSCSNRPQVIVEEHQVILDLNVDLSWIRISNADGKWLPTTSDINNLLDNLLIYLKDKIAQNDSYASDINHIITSIDTYYVQFAGFTKNNDKFIYCNFIKSHILEERDDIWRSKLILVEDCGYEFWNIEYNYDKKSFQSLKINND